MKSETRIAVSNVCTHCNKEFKYESEKRRHEQSHVPQFECKVCLKKFSFVSALRRHEKQHERTESVQCKKCKGRFRDESLLKRHMQYAHRGTHKCKKCSATLHSELALHTHMKTHRPESERRFRCSYEGCGKTFNFTHHLKHHELTHTDDKPHICIECGKRFIQLHHLKIHQRVHKPDCWLPCTVLHCCKVFTNEYALRRHIVTHKEIKPEKKKKVRKVSHKNAKAIEELYVSKSSEIDLKKEINITVENSSKNFTDIAVVKSLDIHFEILDMATINKFKEFGDHVDTVNENDAFNYIELSTSNCTSTIGKCLVTGDTETNDSCLCAQMSNKTTNDKNNEAILANNHNTKVHLLDNLKCVEKRLIDINACESCECASICGIRNKPPENVAYESPKLEIRKDNIVKIKDTFDIDIGNIENYANDVNDDRFDLRDEVNIFNSCKDILGNCIVSGDGTIGEGCLCAKMTANDQQVIAQEIEEITPNPKSNWFKQELR